jgi:hypothetical protein
LADRHGLSLQPKFIDEAGLSKALGKTGAAVREL